jgi:uncharacterized membrane protein YdjX (TVP38/TMEM64 family)
MSGREKHTKDKHGHGHPRRSARSVLLFAMPKKRTWWILASIVLALVGAVALVLLLTDLDWSSVQRGFARLNTAMERLNPVAVIPLMAVLPIFGFPIGIVYLVAGARFGMLGGGVIVAAVTAIHLVASYYIGRSFLRGPIERFIEKRHHHLPQVPEDEQILVCVIAALLPGLPYFVRNYLLVLAGVRLKIMFWVCWPIYIARSYATILLGDFSGDPSRRGLMIVLVVDGLKIAICAFVIWRLREHHRKYHPAHGPDVAVPPSGAGR